MFSYDRRYPSIESLERKARARIPKFVFDYVNGGCNEDINVKKNTSQIRDIELTPQYLVSGAEVSMKTELFGHIYDAPFGIAPVGLQGLVWPRAAEILANAAFQENIPFILSTVSTCNIERISEITHGRAWFQLYHPAEDQVRNSIVSRAKAAGCPVLVILSDVPTFGYRPREIRNGLSLPPKLSFRNFVQIAQKPEWGIKTLINGVPGFQTMKPYMPEKLNLRHLGQFMNRMFDGRLTYDKVAQLRDLWKDNLVVKGVASPEDVEKLIRIGVDGIIVSNHGGRQLDAAESSIHSLHTIVREFGGKIKVMMDSGIRSGPDVARCMAAGAAFTFLGRAFMYGVAALGEKGAAHTINILKAQLYQVMTQISCKATCDFPQFIVSQKK